MITEARKCIRCGVDFISNYKSKIYCTERCRLVEEIEKSGRYVDKENMKIPTGSVGAMSELFVSGDLIKKGYSVFRALSPSCYCDLIAMKDKKMFQIEVRTGYESPATKKLTFVHKLRLSADTYAVYERNSGTIFYLDSNRNIIKL